MLLISVDTINKCSFKDDKCCGNLIQNVITTTAPTGIPEFNIPIFDPKDLSGLVISVFGLVNITVEEGTATGVKGCEIKHIQWVI